jgi:1,4-dihydroxy-2-naphthoyl-CoA hydrolase
MAIWFQPVDLTAINQWTVNSMDEHLGIQFTEVGEDYIKGTLPVDHRTQQPFGLLHGGASVVLAESLGSVGANLCVDGAKYFCVGLEINANHLRPVTSGTVTGVATPINRGRSFQIWDIRIYNEEGKMNCISRLTVAVRERE